MIVRDSTNIIETYQDFEYSSAALYIQGAAYFAYADRLFDAPPKDIAGLPDPFGADPLEVRARSYLQTNCSICHRPGGEFNSIDMRFTTAFADMNLCDPVERDMGVVPDYRVVPGNPADSTMSFRMHALDDMRMPKIGSKVVDPEGSKLIDDWITALPTNLCPPQPPL